jgi:hypothetical protein
VVAAPYRLVSGAARSITARGGVSPSSLLQYDLVIVAIDAEIFIVHIISVIHTDLHTAVGGSN